MLISSQSFMVDFRAEYRQFDWIEISLVYIENDKHNTVYNCYNLEKASTFIQSVSLKNILQFYSIANQLRLDVNNSTYKHLMYTQLVNWNCNGCSIASIMVMQLVQYFKNCRPKSNILQIRPKVYYRLHDSKEHTTKLKN